MESRPLRWERARMSAAALLTVQMAITAFVSGAGAPIAPPAARPPDPFDPYGPAAAGDRHRRTGDRPGEPVARIAVAHMAAGSPSDSAPSGSAPSGSAPARWRPTVRLAGAPFAPILVADRVDRGSGGYGRAGGLVKLLGMSAEAKAPEHAKTPKRAKAPAHAKTAKRKAPEHAKTLGRPQHPLLRSYARLPHHFAAQRLRAAGIKRRSSGNCTSKHRPTCTSYTAIRANTVAKLIMLKRRSRCPIVVTGGTETGHAPGRHSHGNGYKVDVARNRCLDTYIRRKHTYVGRRSDGAALYRSGRSAHGDVYALESNHWDITFR